MKEIKQLKPPQNPKRLPTCKHKVGKNNNPETNKQTNKNKQKQTQTQNKTKQKPTKSQESNRLLSATKEWMATVIRAQSKNNCANDKQMESQTNHK